MVCGRLGMKKTLISARERFSMRNKSIIILLVAYSFFLTGCFDSPEKGAKEWFNAMLNYDGNKILDRTCLAQRTAVQEAGLWNSAFALLPQLFGLDLRSQGDVSGIKFSRTSINADETIANVRVHGEIRIAVLAIAQAIPFDETWLMIKEDDVWRWCGVP